MQKTLRQYIVAWLEKMRTSFTRLHSAPFAATRARLAAVNVAVVSGILVVMALAIFWADAHATNQQIDQQLQAVAARVTNTHPDFDVSGSGAHEATDPTERYEPSSPNVFTVILTSTGQSIIDPGKVGALIAAQHMPTSPTFMTVTRGAHTYRLYLVPLTQDGQHGYAQIGMSYDARNRQLSDLFQTLLWVSAGMLVLTALVSAWLAERALAPARQAYERQRQFSAAASHELRTPLAFIHSQLDLIARQARRKQDDAMLADVADVTAEVAYMSRLIADLALLSRSGITAPLPHALVDVHALVDDVVLKMQPLAMERGITLQQEKTHAGRGNLVHGDTDRLRQLIIILVDNAIQYTPEGGKVEVQMTAKSAAHRPFGGHDTLCLSISDTGIGMAPEHLECICEPFYQIDPARAHGGSGLGLALASWIIDQHHGTLQIESASGKGSTFRVTFPLIHGSRL